MIDVLELTGAAARFREAYRARTDVYDLAATELAELLRERNRQRAAELREAKARRRLAAKLIGHVGELAAAATRAAQAHSRAADALWTLKAQLAPPAEPDPPARRRRSADDE